MAFALGRILRLPLYEDEVADAAGDEDADEVHDHLDGAPSVHGEDRANADGVSFIWLW